MNRSRSVARLALLVPHMVLTLLALTARSTSPFILGRWSKALFAVNAVNLLALAMVVIAGRRGRVGLVSAALFALLGITYIAATNNELSQTRLAIPMMIASRFGISLLFVALAVDAAREARDTVEQGAAMASRSRRFLALGASLVMLNVVDASGVALFRERQAAPESAFNFRSPVDLARIEPDAVIVVGDSFVWGQGVDEPHAFANRLGDGKRRVYNLGQSGTGLPEYISVLEQVGARDTAIVCFYMNDMTSRESPLTRVRQALLATGKASFLARLVSDFVGLRMYPDAAAYERSMIADYDPSDGTFAARWDLTISLLRRAALAAKRGSKKQPILVILPIMYEYAKYPLRQAHASLAAVGAESGFEVIDMLPIFAEAFPHGDAYKAGPNDNHFNAEVHAKVAEVLRAALARRSPAAESQ